MAIGSFISGFVGGAVDTVKGLAHVVTHPVETVQGLGHAITHPVETYEGIKNGIQQSFADDPAKASGRAVFEVLSLFGPAALTKVSKLATVAKGAEVAADVSKVAEVTSTAAKAGEVASTATKAGKTAEVTADAARAGKTAEVTADAGKAGKAAEVTADATKTGEAAKAAVAPELLEGADKLPKSVKGNFGHGANKHGIKSAEQIEDLRKTIKPKQTVTWFKDEATMQKAAGQAPEALKDILANNPAKRAEFEAFLKTEKEGAAFGYRFDVPGETSLGGGMKNVAGQVDDVAAGNTAYVQYKWAKAKGGAMEPQVFTIYPVAP